MKKHPQGIVSVRRRKGIIRITFVSGLLLAFPANRRLLRATPQQLRNAYVAGGGLHWPELDEDLSFEGLLEGRFG
jgi:hypothetical protein